MNSSAVLELSLSTSYAVVVAPQRLIVVAEGASSVAVNGVTLPMIQHPTPHWWWHLDRAQGWHLLTVDWVDTHTTVMVECIHEVAQQQVVDELYAQLLRIDERLCAGKTVYRQFSCDRYAFESDMGMSSTDCLTRVRQSLEAPLRTTQSAWNGASPSGVRFDQVAFDGSSLLPVQHMPEHAYAQSDVQPLVDEIFHNVESFNDERLDRIVAECRAVLTRVTRVSSASVAYLTTIVAALRRCRLLNPGSLYHRTADVALLYERWVWVQSLFAFDIDDAGIRTVLDGSPPYDLGVSDSTWCAYQRRFTTTYSSMGWSRDGRIAIPDVYIWQQNADGSYRALVIDAKWSSRGSRLSADALNDGTAYLRRIGVGTHNPDAVLLVYPGDERAVWPSDLIVIGSNGLDGQRLRDAIQRWLRREPI